MRKKKGTIREAILHCLKDKEGDIHKWDLLHCIYSYLQKYNRHPYEETITRELRRLRQQGLVNYQVINANKGEYKIIRRNGV